MCVCVSVGCVYVCGVYVCGVCVCKRGVCVVVWPYSPPVRLSGTLKAVQY